MLNSQRLHAKLLYYMCLGNGRDGNLIIEAQWKGDLGKKKPAQPCLTTK